MSPYAIAILVCVPASLIGLGVAVIGYDRKHSDRIRRWLFRRLFPGLTYIDINTATWQSSFEWDDAHVNDDLVWDAEPDQNLLCETIALARSSPERAFRTWRDQAERGSVWSMCEVGRCYSTGVGVERDPKQAEAWYRRASEGDRNARCSITTAFLPSAGSSM